MNNVPDHMVEKPQLDGINTASNPIPTTTTNTHSVEPDLHDLDMSPEDVVIGGPNSSVTVTGLKVMSTRDALTIFEACRRGILPRIVRRLTESERQQINEGTVVVFDEKQANMKRWTDGRQWTPSRILGNFLVYRELDRKVPPNYEGAAEISRLTQSDPPPQQHQHSQQYMQHNAVTDGVHSSNKGLFFCKRHGLIKRTISLSVPDNEDEFLTQTEWRPPRVHQQHLIAYFRAETAALLPTPDDMEELQGLRLPLPILRIQRFRRPLKIEMFEDSAYDVYDTEDDEDPACGEHPATASVGANSISVPHATPGPKAHAHSPHHRALMLLAPPPAPLFASDEAGYYVGAPHVPAHPSPLALQPPVAAHPHTELPAVRAEHYAFDAPYADTPLAHRFNDTPAAFSADMHPHFQADPVFAPYGNTSAFDGSEGALGIGGEPFDLHQLRAISAAASASVLSEQHQQGQQGQGQIYGADVSDVFHPIDPATAAAAFTAPVVSVPPQSSQANGPPGSR
ncbi:Global transcription regulator sge1 [Coemansia sp. RSA 2618]|nr:Global transcription regulator sge1 [Coemansia sp. RSA 2618]